LSRTVVAAVALALIAILAGGCQPVVQPTVEVSNNPNAPWRGATIPVLTIRAGLPATFGLAPLSGSPCAIEPRNISLAPLGRAGLEKLSAAPGIRRTVFFVPGFATSLPLALEAAHRIGSSLGASDLLVVVDWGSLGRKSAYRHDAKSASAAGPPFAAILASLHNAHPQREFDVFAHSMGARVVATGMSVVSLDASTGHIVQRAVFAAPDMTIGDYRRAITRNPVPFAHATIYASRRDNALLLSTIIHLHRRLGQLGVWRKPIAWTDVVDASLARVGRDGHGYAIHDTDVMRDIGATLAGAPVPHPDWRRAKPDAISWTYLPPGGVATGTSCGR
jgi:esterase/lipase superfamily enzyme